MSLSRVVVVAGALYLWQGWVWLDPAISLAIALLIFYVTWGLLRQSLHLVFDGVPSSIRLPEVSDYLMGLPGVSEVHDLHVWAMSTSEIALTVHLTLSSGHPGDAFYTEATAGLWQRFGIAHVTIQIELGDSGQECCCNQDYSDLDSFLGRVKSNGFTVTAMAFQDAYTLDMERLRRCSLHVYRDGRIIPFCANYLTAVTDWRPGL